MLIFFVNCWRCSNTASQIFVGCNRLEDDAVEEEEKELAVISHSEKLAICFGFINTMPGLPLYNFKNLRICQDCHLLLRLFPRFTTEKLSSEIAIVFIVSRKDHVLVMIIGNLNCIVLITSFDFPFLGKL